MTPPFRRAAFYLLGVSIVLIPATLAIAFLAMTATTAAGHGDPELARRILKWAPITAASSCLAAFFAFLSFVATNSKMRRIDPWAITAAILVLAWLAAGVFSYFYFTA